MEDGGGSAGIVVDEPEKKVLDWRDYEWALSGDGQVLSASVLGVRVRESLFNRGRLFRTKGEAEADRVSGYDAKLVAQVSIDRYCDVNGIENKWVKGGQNNYPVWDGRRGHIWPFVNENYQVSTIFNVATFDEAIQIIRDCEAELKVLFGQV